MMMSGRRNTFPFTANQWEELQHQALIFKYMVSGIPIPPHLLFGFNIRTSSNPQHGWNCFIGRKADPEPWRCRRTDGKKWRCSKQACNDSKYCERHMHRGKNRSRKPVEEATATAAATTTMAANQASTATAQSLTLTLSSSQTQMHPHALGIGLSLKENTTHEYAFFSEPPGRTRSFMDDDSCRLTPLTMSCSSSSKQRNKNDDGSIKWEKREAGRKIHRFFDEWPPLKHRDSSTTWLDNLDDKLSNSSSASTVNQALNLQFFN